MNSVFHKYESLIESLHISDQYTGVVDDTAEDESGGVVVKVPERKIIFTYTGKLLKINRLLRQASQFLLQPPSQLNMET